MGCYNCGMAQEYNAGNTDVYSGGRSIMQTYQRPNYGGAAHGDYNEIPGSLGMRGDYRVAQE